MVLQLLKVFSRVQSVTGKKTSWEPTGCPVGRDSSPLVPKDLPDNPISTARLNRRSRWASNPHLPKYFGYSIAVKLREYPQCTPGFRRKLRTRFGAEGNTVVAFGKFEWAKWCRRYGASQTGNRTRYTGLASSGSSHGEQPPLYFGAITCNFRPHRNCKIENAGKKCYCNAATCFRSSMVEQRSLKSRLWVQFPSEAPEFDESINSDIVFTMT